MKKIFFALVFSLFICGCGPKKDESTKVYEAESYEFGDGLDINVSSMSFINGAVFFSVSDSFESSEIYRYNPGYGKLRCVIGEHSESEPVLLHKVCCFSDFEDGSLGLITTDMDSFMLQTFSKASYEQTGVKPISLDFSDKDNSLFPHIVLFANDKNVIISKDIFCVDESGYSRKLSMGDGVQVTDAVLTSEDRIFVFSFGKNGIYEYNPDTNKLENLDLLAKEHVIGISGSRYSSFILAYTDKELYKINPGKKEAEKILNWADLNILGTEVQCVEELNGEFRCITYNMSDSKAAVFIIKEADPGKAKNKLKEIVVASCAPNDFLKKAVSEYNNTHGDYKITIKEYKSSDYAYSVEDRNHIIRDILAGESIDIIDLSGFEYNSPSYLDLIDNKYIENLVPYFEKSDKLSLDNFLDEAVALFDYEGYLGAVTNLFGLSCYLADKEAVPDGTITVTELIDYDLSHDEFKWPEGYNENAILKACLYHNLDSFVNLENGTCDFDNELFRKIMDYAMSYTGNNQTSGLTGKESIRFFSIDKLTDTEIALQTQLEGNAIICGLPSTDGTFRTQMTSLNGCALAIASKSENKNHAWDFIEYCLSEYPIAGHSVKDIDTYGFPSKKDFLERYFDLMAEEDGPLDKTYYIGYRDSAHTIEVTLHPLTEEGRQKIMSYIKSSRPYDLRYQPIVEIISEDVGYYFEGKKSIDEIIRIVDKRVSIYLQENK